ncbi:hypothetical protein T281_09370 [Rhodomicrobium udaipurense JA643]|uniref:PD-(D/E)XK motif protein n=1 Tax=Rhodomicrobium udaipurense TaxID=1202716 RepID=A0A8I1GC88_9HYPH|nr:PD-(D/E)XK motif protein [Rhodomicrobium udaipurense]KAI94730.1 hypothetical protein T281_09370 [Rhodomicrobium udaipurense JA643]MBJ7542234.1 PD-(D/E)XK motif protein [Rhodomicrobium udaipurense]
MAAPSNIDGLHAAWRALAGAGGGEGWNTIRLSISSSCTVLAGRRSPGDAEAILVGFRHVKAIPESQLPQGHGFEVIRLRDDPIGGNRTWLALARRAGGSPELFAMMAEDLVRLIDGCEAVEDAAILQRFLARIRTWQDFMDRHREGILSEEAELGLFGELIVLSEMIDAGVPVKDALDAWLGPLEGLQDFVLGSGGMEVKATLSGAGFPATVSSLEQLDDTLRQPLFLAAVRLSLHPSGKTLPVLADDIKQRLRETPAMLETFDVRLMQAGLLPTCTGRYSRSFLKLSLVVLPVTDTFPHLTRSKVHPAIRRARYEIDLDLAETRDIGLAGALELMEAI